MMHHEQIEKPARDENICTIYAEEVGKITACEKILYGKPDNKSNLFQSDTEISDPSVFWYMIVQNSEKGKPKLKISVRELLEFLEFNGFYKMFINDTNLSIFIRIENKIVNITTPERMKDFVMEYIKTLPSPLPKASNFTKADLLEMLVKGANFYFGKDKLECLSEEHPKFQKDDKKTCHFYFRNGFAIATIKGKEFYKYDDLAGVIWKNQIIKREYTKVQQSEKGEFEQFLSNVCGNDEQRFNAICTAIGFLLHRYKDKSCAKVIVFVDENISENPDGRTGKTLIGSGIENIKVTVILDGKLFKFDSQFALQSVNLDTEVLVFDDVDKKFQFEKMFHMVTSGLEFEKKNKDRIKLDFEDSPKYLITSNYVLNGEGGSAEARKSEYELSPHYSIKHSPRDEFGHNLFDDWDKNEWIQFDNFMIDCVSKYLKDGLLDSPKINLNERKLLQGTAPEFVEFMDDIYKKDGNINPSMLNVSKPKNILFSDFCKQHEYFEKQRDRGYFAQRKFTGWLKHYAKYNGLDSEEKKERYDSKSTNVIIFLDKTK